MYQGGSVCAHRGGRLLLRLLYCAAARNPKPETRELKGCTPYQALTQLSLRDNQLTILPASMNMLFNVTVCPTLR